MILTDNNSGSDKLYTVADLAAEFECSAEWIRVIIRRMGNFEKMGGGDRRGTYVLHEEDADRIREEVNRLHHSKTERAQQRRNSGNVVDYPKGRVIYMMQQAG